MIGLACWCGVLALSAAGGAVILAAAGVPAIVAVLAAADGHPNADDVLAMARALDDTVSFATVYRTLSVLEGAGLVRKLPFDDAPARYEMMPQSDHDHLVDIDTGELIEIPGDEIARLRAGIAASLGYEVVSQHTILRGRRLR